MKEVTVEQISLNMPFENQNQAENARNYKNQQQVEEYSEQNAGVNTVKRVANKPVRVLSSKNVMLSNQNV